MTIAETTHAASQSSPDLAGGLALMVVGMGVVFISLIIIGVVVFFLRRFLDRPTEVVFREKADVPDRMPTALNPRLIAVIAAAATTAVGRPVRVQRVVMLGRSGRSDWVSGGRATIMGSHAPYTPTDPRKL